MNEDAAIVNSILRGNMHAFKGLVDQHQKLVLHMVGRVLDDPEDCEDICQEVFIKVYKNLGKFNFQSKLSTWIATIAYRTAINHVKKYKKKAKYEAEEHYHMPEAETGQTFEKTDVQHFIQQQIQQLPLAYKTVITLFHLEEMNYAEIMEVTGMPEGTVKSYLFRARKMLKEKLQTLMIKEELL